MGNKPTILATMKRGQAIGAVEHFGETFNWCTQWTANIEAGTGVRFKNKDSDHPTIEADIIAGKGISVKEYNGSIRISLEEEEEEDDGNSPNRRSGGGKGGGSSSGNSSGGSGSGGSGSGGGSVNGGGGYGGGSGNSPGEGGSGSGSPNDGTNCNRFSGDLGNDLGDAGLDNDGDDCDELNGW